LNRLVDLDEILHGGDGIEEDFDFILLKPVASTISKWQTFKLLRWAQLLNRLVDLDEILHGDDDIEEDFDFILLKPVASTISKWQTFKLLRWAQLLNRLVIWMKFCMEVMALNIVFCELM
jgi:hypothetical protein